MGRGSVAFSVSMGQCASTHNLYSMECPREVRALWRAFFTFPFEERADGPQGVGSVWAQHPSRSSESMCLDRIPSDRKMAPLCRMKTTWVLTRCSSSGYMDPATQLPSFYKTGRWKGSLELPKSPGHAVPGITRSGKDTWLVRILSASCL